MSAHHWELGGKVAFHGPACPCTSRNQRKVGYLQWLCACGRENHYRVTGDGFIAMRRETAAAWDERMK